MKRTIAVLFGATLLCCSDLTQAQGPGETLTSGPQLMANAVASDMPPNIPGWGVSSPIAYVVPGMSFIDRGDAQHDTDSGYIYKSGGTTPYFYQVIHLPSGAVIDGLTTYFYDTDPTSDVMSLFYRWTGTTGTGLTPALLLADSSSGTGGYQGGYDALAVPETIHNVAPTTGEVNMYVLMVQIAPSVPGAALRFGGVVVWYRLQISPAPATATFSDVPTDYWAFRHIEALAASGITAGCGGGNYCPENTVTRAEMAVFLAKALGLHWSDGATL